MHWIGDAAARAGFKGANAVMIPAGAPTTQAWEISAKALGVSPVELASRIAPAVKLAAAKFDSAQPRAARLVPEKIARRFGVFPLRDDDRQLVVATSDPTNFEAEQSLGFAAGRRIVFELAPPQSIARAIERAYASDRTTETVLSQLDARIADAVRVIEDTRPEQVAAHDVEAAPVVQLTNMILRDAIVHRASDIHIEPGDGGGTVRFRIDGVMRQHMPLPMPALNRVVSRIKVLGKLDIADRVRPQDGRTRIQVENRTYDLRISTVPIRESEKAVIRILRPDTSSSLDDVDLDGPELERLRGLLGNRDGIVLVTGPTGSGKTTTMYAALRELAKGDVNITTVEDPVEYELAGIAQIQVDTKRGVTFASALRAVLRQDPDVIFVGEIRDSETAEIAVQAAMTGHLVLATLHTNDAISAVPRLIDLGLDRSAIGSSVRGSLAQRLVRRLCDECAIDVDGDLTADEERISAALGVRPKRRAVGCVHCSGTGYQGRLPVDEVAVFTADVAEQITQGATAAALQRSVTAGGMRGLREAAAARVERGETTLSEVERVVGLGGEPPSKETVHKENVPHVLIVDDDPVQRLLVRTLLAKQGFDVQEANDGEQAMRHIASGAECALVLTDLQMPKLDGEALVKRLRSDAHTAALPIIVVTSTEDEARESELIDIGADDYLRKPVDAQRLVARVKAALRRAAT